MERFKSKNALKFKTAPHVIGGAPTGMDRFEVGNVHGLWVQSPISIDVWSIINNESEPDADHIFDVLEWFIELARLAKVPLRILELKNMAFKAWLIDHWKFERTEMVDQVIKTDFLK